jgi:methylglutaconyl-CoA hydratase
MVYENIKLDTDARGVARLTLARAEKLNALSVEMMREIHDALDRLATEDDLRALVLTGEGRTFCAGGDINMFKAMASEPREVRLASAMRGLGMAEKIAALPVPVVGRINGPAYGGSIGMLAATDVAIGAEEAKFAFTELRRGVVLGGAMLPVTGRIGPVAYKRLLFTGQSFDAHEALALGLLDEVVPKAELDGAVEAALQGILASAPKAAAAMKAAVNAAARRGNEGTIFDGINAFADSWASDEGREGTDSFLEKRKPYWDRSG